MPWFGAIDLQSGGRLHGDSGDAGRCANRYHAAGRRRFVYPSALEASRRDFSYDRKIRYAFFDRGGYVAQAKRYRDYAKETGLFKTLRTSAAQIPMSIS